MDFLNDIQWTNGQPIDNKPAGQTVCDSVAGYPDCKNSGNSFRCVCDDSNINWNQTSKSCEPLIVGNDRSNWNVLEPETFLLFPTKESNYFTLNFNGVDKPDQLCLSISYVSKSNSMLHVAYRGDVGAAETTFDYFLLKSPDKGETVEVCLNHFRFRFEDTFKLRMSISDLSAFNEDTFKINLIETNFNAVPIKEEIFLNKWDSKKVSDHFTDHWQILPNKINVNEVASLTVSKNEFVTIRYISSWIKEDPYFGDPKSESYFKIDFGDKESANLVQINKKILYHTDEKLTKIMDLTSSEKKISEKEIAYKLSNFPKNIYQRFRIIIDITMKTPKDKEQKFNVVFNSFSIGDPCFIDLGETPYCKPSKNKLDATCNAIGPDPKGNTCECKDTSVDNCQWDNVCDSEADIYCENYIVDSSKKCHQITSNEYECSCPQKYFKRDKKKCLIKKKIGKKVIECTGKSCPFMTNLGVKFNWASKELPRLNNAAEKDSKLPFYYTNKKDNLITFKFTGKDNTDICAKLEYSSTGNFNFSISYDKDHKSIQLPKTPEKSDIYSEQKICISDLAEPIIKDMIFNLKFETNSDLSQVAVVHLDKSAVIVSNNQDSLKLLSPLPYLVQYDSNIKEDKFHPKNQWPLLLPSKNSEWEVVTDSNTIKFTTQYSGIRESFLFSHWLEPNKEHILFRTNISNIDPLNDFEMEFLLYDNKLSATNLVPKMIFNSQSIIDNGVEETVHIPIPPQKTAFRVAIKVTYNVEQQSLFELVGTDIGDPCIIDGNIINTCYDRGTCKRNENGYTCECRTDPDTKLNFTGNNCEIKDFCKTPIAKDEKKLGQDVCNEYKSNCTNVENGFKCVCPDKDTYWDVPDKKCLPIPKCFTHKCGDNEICGDDKQGNATCLCEDGYVRNNKTNGGCELYDPCNQLHRLWKNPPEDLNRCVLGGKCVALSKGKHSDWYCLCEPGYKKTGVKDLTTCTSLICDNKWMNKCQQKCEIDNTIKDHPYNCSCFDNYIRDGDNCKFNTSFKKCEKCDTFDKYCDITGNCVCKPEFEEQSDKSCKMKIDESVCPTKNYTKDSSGNQYCDCGPFYDYNKAQSTCDLKPICAKGGRGRDKCDKQNKICTLNPKKEELFECVCPANLREDKTRDNKCVNNCVFENNFDKCASRNAICNPYRSLTDLCECPPGFEMTKPLSGDSICVVNEFSSRFSLQFKNDYIFSNCKSLYDEETKPLDLSLFNHDLNGFLKDSIEGEKLNRAIRELILSEERIECFSEEILKEMIKLIPANSYKKDSMENKCSKLKSGDLSCTFSVVFTNEKEQKNTNIFNNLRDSCVPFGDNKECFILLDDPVKPYSSLTSSAQTQSKVILDNNSVKGASLTSNKGCGEPTDKQNPCPRFSNCVQDKTNAYYNCTCNKEYFTPLNPVTNLLTATGTNLKYIIEKCEEKDICTQKCTTKNGNNCVQNATQINGGAWKVQYACNCLDPLMRNNVTACTEACSNIECKNGVNNIKAGICHCECNEGYYGEACKLESSTSKGGWIAGIVVLAVLVVILAGVAFMFARRSRNNSTEYSGRPMDDYTGSSYRVPPNQSRGQQNPSFTRE